MVLVGMLLGVGVLVLDSYGRAARTTTTVTDASVNVSTGAATLSQTYCLTVGSIINSTGGVAYSATTYNVSYTTKDTCVITSDLPLGQLYNITYTYGASNAAQVAADNTNSAITPISSTWMPLIVTVVVLSIILMLVMSSFGMRR